MVCIYCTQHTDVINSRPQKKTNRVWRRRHCSSCGATFTTIEAAELAASYMVRRKGRLQPFLRDKLLISLHNSLKHRQAPILDAAGLTDTIIARLPEILAAGGLLESIHLTALTIDVLNKFDPVAGTHYQAFHSPRSA